MLYHLTKLDNLDNICKHGLLSRKELTKRENIIFSDIADAKILEGRELFNLDNKIPFHFHTYSAFDFAVKDRNRGDEFIYLCLGREVARNMHAKILPLHPLSKSNSAIILYDYDEGFSKIDWEAMKKDGNKDEYIKCTKMAECLLDSPLSIENIQQIIVKDKQIETKVRDILNENKIVHQQPYVNISQYCFRK